jgi:uncharacterized LabA/DUF88 family protein
MMEMLSMKGKNSPTDRNFYGNYVPERIGLFIDGANNYTATRLLGFEMDYAKLLSYVRKRGRLMRAFYYTSLIDGPATGWLLTKLDWMAYNGYTMITKQAKEFQDDQGRRRIKGNMDVELSIDMLEMVPYLDHVMLFSGDGDFRRLVEVVQRRGIHVTVVSTARTARPVVSDELRRQADTFVDLYDIAPLINRTWYAERKDGDGDDFTRLTDEEDDDIAPAEPAEPADTES